MTRKKCPDKIKWQLFRNTEHLTTHSLGPASLWSVPLLWVMPCIWYGSFLKFLVSAFNYGTAGRLNLDFLFAGLCSEGGLSPSFTFYFAHCSLLIFFPMFPLSLTNVLCCGEIGRNTDNSVVTHQSAALTAVHSKYFFCQDLRVVGNFKKKNY